MSDLKPPIFLLGNVRSGTSMMLRFFDAHPDVVSWYEPRTVWCYAAPTRPHDRFTERDATPRVRRYIRGRFLKYQRRHGGLRVMEKTPSNMFRIPYVRAIFPEAKFVYIVREPLANLSSSEIRWRKSINRGHLIERLAETPRSQLPFYVGRLVRDQLRKRVLRRRHVSVWGVRYPGIGDDLRTMSTEEVIAKQWASCSRQAEEDLADLGPGTVHRLRYEDFVSDPVTRFREVLAHFDLPPSAEVDEEVRTSVDPNRQQKWRRLDPAVIERCLPYLADEMERHGYEIPDVRGAAVSNAEVRA
jgi:hypothetical protein